MAKRTRAELAQLQGLPLYVKIKKTQLRVRELFDEFGEDGGYVSFSGGKDSTVLLDIVRKMFPGVEAVYCDTGIEYPEIRKFVKGFENVVWLKPKKPMVQIIREYGYPLISKEVAEAVEGARKYLTYVLENPEFDRQTDRQTDRADALALRMLPDREDSYSSRYRRVRGIGEYSKFSESPSTNQSGGGAESDIHSSLKSSLEQADMASLLNPSRGGTITSTENSVDLLSIIKFAEMKGLGGGGSAWRFGQVTGAITSKNTIDSRLFNRQCQGSKNDRDTSNEGKSNDGDYP